MDFRMVVATVAAVVVAATTACGRAPQDDYPEIVTTFNGERLKGDPVSVLQYRGNTNIFLGEVMGFGSPRKGDLYVYTPVVVKVTEAYRGDRSIVGRPVAIRAIGGQVGRETSVSETSPPPDAYRKGMKVYVFAPDFAGADDGMLAVSPNFVYAENDHGQAYNLQEPEQKMWADNFYMMVMEADGWGRIQPSTP